MTDTGGTSVLRLVADPYPPYQYAAGDAVVGLDHDLIAAAFAAAGVDSTTRLLPWPQCLRAMRDGTADAIFQITPTPERAEWLAFSRPFRSARTLLYAPAGAVAGELRGEELPRLAEHNRIGVLEGFSYAPVIDDLPNRVQRPTDADLLAALRAGDVDLAVMDQGVAEHLLDGAADIAPVAGFCISRPLHLASRLGAPEVVAAFEAGLDAARGATA